ncbi:MAG: ROK family protein [Candidatus Gastranaerophilales bacterium]|nr:ROK family protein [Candidatus Gastranaerophilales bacterium]
MKNFSIGIDLGGTKILAAVVNLETGKVLSEVKNKTKKIRGNDDILKITKETTEELLEKTNIPLAEIKSIGLGLAGQVDRKNGILVNAVNLECKNLDFKTPLEKKFGIPVYTGNDVEVATLGELKFGAGVKCDEIVCIFIGTGIGSGIVSSGKIRLGASETAGEIGHIIVDLNGRACSCGANGCLEAYASRSAIESRILGAVKKGRNSVITDFTKSSSISSKHIKKALEAHDEVVTQYVTEAVEYLSGGIASIMNFYNPKLIILGGGLIQSVDEFYFNTVKKARMKALPIPSRKTEFKKAALGDYSGVVGASLLCLN